MQAGDFSQWRTSAVKQLFSDDPYQYWLCQLAGKIGGSGLEPQARADAIRLQAQVEASAIEIDHLRQERTQADQQLAEARADATRLQAQIEASATEIDRLRQERTQADQRREDVQQQLGEARERAAGLSGQLEAVQSQNAALLARLPAAESKPGKR